MNLEEIFPTIKDAHAYLRHRKYRSSLEVYVEILNDVNEESEEYAYILLEYAQCLLESVMYQSEMNYMKLLQRQNSQIPEDEIEEDLENCWECLETCRLHFEDLNNRQKLVEVYKGLGDVYCLKNSFEEGRLEYLKAIDNCDDDLAQIEILECIADCFRNVKKYPEAIEYYNQIVNTYEKLNMKSEADEVRGLIEGLKILDQNQIQS